MKKAKVKIEVDPYPKGGCMLLKELAVKFGGTLLIINQWNWLKRERERVKS